MKIKLDNACGTFSTEPAWPSVNTQELYVFLFFLFLLNTILI